jgi:hypothetical protein
MRFLLYVLSLFLTFNMQLAQGPPQLPSSRYNTETFPTSPTKSGYTRPTALKPAAKYASELAARRANSPEKKNAYVVVRVY